MADHFPEVDDQENHHDFNVSGVEAALRLWRMAGLRRSAGCPTSRAMNDTPKISPVVAGLTCRCPRCGKGRLFASMFGLTVRERCADCGFDLAFVDPGDGPAVFAIMILGFMILGGALLVEFKLHPPLWVHAVLWPPITLVVALGLLRPLKGLLIALQYHHKAEQGKLEKD